MSYFWARLNGFLLLAAGVAGAVTGYWDSRQTGRPLYYPPQPEGWILVGIGMVWLVVVEVLAFREARRPQSSFEPETGADPAPVERAAAHPPRRRSRRRRR